jgi:hypothetical protein
MVDLEKELSQNIDLTLVKELIENYIEVKRRFGLNDLSSAVQAAGRFCESTMKCIVFLYDRRITSKMGLSFDKTYNYILGTPKPTDTISEYKFRLIPEVAKGIYTLRNKKKGQHARGEDLLYIDLRYIVQACDWIIASLLFVSHRVKEEDAIEKMRSIVEFDTPLIQKIGNFLVLTRNNLERHEVLVLLLFSKGGKATQTEIAKNLMLEYSESVSYKIITSGHNDRLIFLDPDTKMITLLPKGKTIAEELAERFKIA